MHYQRGYFSFNLPSAHAQGVDDAYISYRYGWNLAHYGNLSWNESGYRQAEGFTNPLWVYLSAGSALLGKKEWVYPVILVTSVLVTALFLILLIHSVYTTNQKSCASIIGLLLVATTPAIWLHTTSGLESGVFGLGLALLAYLVLFGDESRIQLIAIFCLAIFIGFLRSDSFVYLGIVLVAALLLIIVALFVYFRIPTALDVSGLGIVVTLLASPLAWVGYAVLLVPIFFSRRWSLCLVASTILLSVP